MKNNDKNFDEILSEKPTKKINILKVNFNAKREYKNIFLCPINKHDVVNSMDILDDIIINGTIMGNVYLCRVDKNNLMPKEKKGNITDLNIFDMKKEIKLKSKNEEPSKISCIKLDGKSDNKSNNDDSLYKANKNEIINDKNKLFYESDIIPTTRNIYNKIKSPELNLYIFL